MNLPFETVCVVGLGYIGLPTAAVLANCGVSVIGLDVNKHAVDTINCGKIHIEEPGLAVMVHGAVGAGKLRATTCPEPADAFVVAVPTPFRNDHKPDLSYIEAATRNISPVLRKGNLVVLESTSPVGSTEKMAEWMAEERPDLSFPHQMGGDADIQVAHCPERVLPGRILIELVENDRVIGGMSAHCSSRAVDLYKTFVAGECVVTDARTAEMAKLTENAFRDVNIAFANELSHICDKIGINVWELIRLANRHPRVNILNPGPGVGGHCIAVDPWFIVDTTPEEARLIRTARTINDGKPAYVVEQVMSRIAAGVEHPVIACLGLAFKANIDDLRESPAVEITRLLAERPGAKILVVEPYVEELPRELKNLGNVVLVDIDAALKQADICVLLVDHNEFKKISRERLAACSLIDTRGIWQ